MQDRDEHIIVCGLDRLGRRTLERVRSAGRTAVAIVPEGSHGGDGVVAGDPQAPATLKAAGIEQASALVMTEHDDVRNLHVALIARELNPNVRVVLRMFNTELAAQVQVLLPRCTMLSASALAAPAFVSALPEELLAAPVSQRRASTRMVEARAALRGLARSGAFQLLLMFLAALVVVSVAIFVAFRGLTPINAGYFAFETLTTTGYGDINLLDASWPVKLYGILLMVFGGASLAVLFALVTNELVSLRLARTLGVVPGGLSDHAVVTGVGSIGYRIIEELVDAGISVAAVEQAETGRFVAPARSLGVPVVVGDASMTQTLSAVRLERARCLFAVTDDDVANLQTALNARALAPELPTVVRLFDADLAERVERDLRLPSRSVSELAAPAFAAAALD